MCEREISLVEHRKQRGLRVGLTVVPPSAIIVDLARTNDGPYTYRRQSRMLFCALGACLLSGCVGDMYRHLGGGNDPNPYVAT